MEEVLELIIALSGNYQAEQGCLTWFAPAEQELFCPSTAAVSLVAAAPVLF